MSKWRCGACACAAICLVSGRAMFCQHLYLCRNCGHVYFHMRTPFGMHTAIYGNTLELISVNINRVPCYNPSWPRHWFMGGGMQSVCNSKPYLRDIIMDPLQQARQKAYKACWAKCRDLYSLFQKCLCEVPTENERCQIVIDYVKQVKPFFDEYYKQLEGIGYDLFSSKEDKT